MRFHKIENNFQIYSNWYNKSGLCRFYHKIEGFFFCSLGIFKIKFSCCALEEGKFSVFFFPHITKAPLLAWLCYIFLLLLLFLYWSFLLFLHFFSTFPSVFLFLFFWGGSPKYHSFWTVLQGRSSNLPFFLLSKFSWPYRSNLIIP